MSIPTSATHAIPSKLSTEITAPEVMAGSRKRKISMAMSSSHEESDKVPNAALPILNTRTQERLQKRPLQNSITPSEDKLENEKKKRITFVAQRAPFNFIYDQYTEVRGAPQMLEISCRKCNAWVMDYQKDGPGNLLRCYTDRIYHPSALRERTFTQKSIHEAKPLTCFECHAILANPFIYRRTLPKPEVRPAYLILKNRPSGQQYSVSSIKLKIREK